MAIDRSWWNALVDDDGSGTTGTVWNKAAIKGLLDAIDAMNPSGAYNGTIEGISGGTPVYSFGQCRFAKTDKTVRVVGRLTASGKGSLAGALAIGGFPYPGAAAPFQGGFSPSYIAGLTIGLGSVDGYMEPGATRCILTCITPGSGSSALIDAAYIGPTGIDVIFGFSYLID